MHRSLKAIDGGGVGVFVVLRESDGDTTVADGERDAVVSGVREVVAVALELQLVLALIDVLLEEVAVNELVGDGVGLALGVID